MEQPHVRRTVPWIREPSFGSTLGQRAAALESGATLLLGPADLVHWGRQAEKTGLLGAAFSAEKEDENQTGYFHFCNGIDYTQGALALERYVLLAAEGNRHERREKKDSTRELTPDPFTPDAAGLLPSRPLLGGSPLSSTVNSNPSGERKQTIISICAYNAFSRSELRARFIVTRNRRQVCADPSYTVFSYVLKRLHTYTRSSVRELPLQFWAELAVLTLVRLFLGADDASRRVCGTVLLDEMVSLCAGLRRCMALCLPFLPRGHLLGTRQTYGASTTAGGDFVKTAKYRNFLADSVVRLALMDKSGNLAALAAADIGQLFGDEFDVLICRLYKADVGRNNDARFLGLVRAHVTSQEHQCQTALLLLEQTRFLIGKMDFEAARAVAARAVRLLPLDFDAWYNLALCYVLEGHYVQALQAINSFPIVFAKKDLSDADHVDGIYDSFAMEFMERAAKGKALDLKTFEAYFPPPKADIPEEPIAQFLPIQSSFQSSPKKSKSKTDHSDLGLIRRIWTDSFQYHPHLRHPITGPFHRSPLSMATPLELSTVDLQILKIASPSSAKLLLAAQSSSNPWSSIIDFDSRSTWGRAYDLLTSVVALIGWDELVSVKSEAFTQKEEGHEGNEKKRGKKTGEEKRVQEKAKENEEQKENEVKSGRKHRGNGNQGSGFVVSNNTAISCKPWLQLLLLVIYDDLRVLIQTVNEDQDRSALSWQIIGLLGWSCKFNLKDSISSLVTSVLGVSSHGGFDYFGTVKVLEMYNEFVLCDGPIDPLCEPYEGRNFTNKLIIQRMSPRVYAGLRAELMIGHFGLENILLCLVKLISYNLRWYAYLPNFLATNTLLRLCEQYDALVIRSHLQIIFKTYEKKEKKASGSFSLRAMFAAPNADAEQGYEFVPSDTIMQYMDSMILWVEQLLQLGHEFGELAP